LWSDDDGILAESEQGMRAALGEKGVAGFSRDTCNRARYHGKKKGKEGKVIEFGGGAKKNRRFMIGRIKRVEATEAVFLGRLFVKGKIEGRAKDVTDALAKAWRRVYMLKWRGILHGSVLPRQTAPPLRIPNVLGGEIPPWSPPSEQCRV
jgi:hypothetical protein